MKKRVLVVFALVMFVLLAGFVIAPSESEMTPEEASCKADCKATYTTYDDVSSCIQSCMARGGEIKDREFDPDLVTPKYGEDKGEDSYIKDEKMEGGDILEEITEEYGDEILTKDDAGLTPDSVFYFLDGIIDTREEKIAEIRVMVEEGKIEEARTAKAKYDEYAKELEEEADPEERENVRRSAAAISNTLEEIEENIPEENKDEFYEEIVDKESNIVTAIEISDKIKDLCVQLAELDPLQYSKICKTGDEAPKWKKKLDMKLTEEQEKEAKKFGQVLKECFKSSGQNCRCEDISFYDFSVFCEKMSSLAVDCEVKNNEEACMAMEEAGEDMPELPEHLEHVFHKIESEFGEARFEMHMPRECVEAGASPKECGLIMAEIHAPPECRDEIKKAIESGKIKGERGAREICDRIMMPPECEGMTPKECAKKMMPPECIEKGLEPRECKKFMDSEFMGEKDRHFGPAPGRDCMGIKDSMERLKCFEEGVKGVGDRYGPKDMPEGEITWQCKEHRIHWPPDCERFMREELPNIERREGEERDRERMEREVPDECKRAGALSPEACERHMRDVGEWRRGDEEYRSEGDYEGYDEGPKCDNCAAQCPGASGTGCGPNGCECYYDDEQPSDNYVPPEDGEPYTSDNEAIPGPDEGGASESGDTGGDGGGSDNTGSSDGEGDSGGGDSGGGGGDSGDLGGGDNIGGEGGITGEVISEFWDYYSG